jgi:outer membrane translocation and assembly module TamA
VVSPLLGYQIAWDSVSRRISEDRRRGAFLGLDIVGAHQSLGSDVTLYGLVSQAKYFLPLGRLASGRFTWAQFWRGGITEARNQPVPLGDRFRLGGEFSVRGYPTNSLGPQSPEGVATGGELLFIVNQELHALLLRTENAGTVSALVFFDAGNAWQSRDSLDYKLFKSVGVGARYNSPVGPLRLDVALPLDRRPDDPTYKIYVGFGSVF